MARLNRAKPFSPAVGVSRKTGVPRGLSPRETGSVPTQYPRETRLFHMQHQDFHKISPSLVGPVPTQEEYLNRLGTDPAQHPWGEGGALPLGVAGPYP